MDDEWIAARLALLCARRNGRSSRLAFHHHAVRTALLIDLADRKRLTRYAQTIDVDTSPTGFAPADRFLVHIDTHPDHTLQRVLANAPLTMLDVIESGGIRRAWYRRAPVLDADRIKLERSRVAAAAGGDCDSRATAALTLLADMLGAVEVAEPGALLGECAELAWAVENGLAYLAEVRTRYELTAAAGRIPEGA